MGLFKRDWSKPGPGIPADAPPKKGAKRFLQIMSESAWDLVKLNLLFCLSILPSAVLFLFWIFGVLGAYAAILSLIAALPVGGALSACYFCITKKLRDDSGYMGYEFKRKFIENWKKAAVPGLLYTAFIYMQMAQMVFINAGIFEFGAPLIVAVLIASLLLGMIVPYVFMQIAYVDLKISQILTNSIIISFSNVRRSFMGALAGGIVNIVFILYFPASLLFMPSMLFMAVFGFSLPWLLCLMWTWPVLDSRLSITETLREQQKGSG